MLAIHQSLISTSGSCVEGSTVRSAISALTGTAGVRGTAGDDVLGSSLRDRASSPIAPFIVPAETRAPFSVRWPFSISPGFAASLAFFSLNCLYVVVLGITSARNSRLSMCETAVAIGRQLWDNIVSSHAATYPDPCIERSFAVFVLT